MFCYNCGTKLEDGLAFCTNCGVKLAEEEKVQIFVEDEGTQVLVEEEGTQVLMEEEGTQVLVEDEGTQVLTGEPQMFEIPREQPVAPQPTYTQPTYTQPAAPQPTYTQPTYTQPTYTQPTYTQPAYNQYQQQAYAYEADHTGSPQKVSFGGAIKLFFKNYVKFTGRSTRSEFWWAYLFNGLVSLVGYFIPVLGLLVGLGFMLPGLSLSVRRLHDAGKSWTYLFMGLIPIAGAIILLIQFCKESDADNQWGPAAR